MKNATRDVRTCARSVLLLGLVALSLMPRLALAYPMAVLEPDDDAGPAAPSFPTPGALESAVDFWSTLFLRHGSDRVVIHDRENMDIVWQVIDLPKDAGGVKVDERAATKVSHDAVDLLRDRLRRLEIDPTPIDDEDRGLLAIAAGSPLPDALQGAWTRLRVQRGVADQFTAGMARCKPLINEIRQVLREERVPEEIAVLPFVESMFNPKARSSVGATGIWQLMPGTARELGLRVNRRHDERTNVLKATRAAARLLRRNYEALGSWPLAITAYNHGANGVRHAVMQVGSTDLTYLIDNYQKATWGFASKNFYAEFLAVLQVLNSDLPPTLPGSARTAAAEQNL